MLKYIRISNKESCPCGSKKIYKDCCKKLAPRKFHSKGEKLDLIGKLMKKSKQKFCLVEGCNSKPRDIILAHALQENRILNKIADNNMVYMQNLNKNPLMLEIIKGIEEPFYLLEEVKIKDATVQTCFCKSHDDDIFRKIEKSQYTFDNLTEEQLFLFAYRAFSFEYYKDISVDRLYKLMCKEVPQLFKNPFLVYKYRHSLIKRLEMEYYKEYFDNGLSRSYFSGLTTFILKIPYTIRFSGYLSIAPPFDLKGYSIKTISKKTKQMKRVFITIVPDEKQSYVLISSLKDDKDVYFSFFDSLINSDDTLIMKYLNVFIPLYSENLIVNPSLFRSFSEPGQHMLQYLVSETSQRRISNILIRLQSGLMMIEKSKLAKHDLSTLPYNLFA